MATEQKEGYFSAPAAADLSAADKLYRGGVYGAGGTIALAGAGVKIDGIIKNDAAQGEQLRIEFEPGVHKARAGAAFAAGAELATDADGEFITAAGAGTHIVAKAIDAAGAQGVIVRVFYGYRGVVPA
jgi:hypothetical protein